MSTPYLSEIRIFSFGFAPRGWALCNGQTMNINQNQALFSLIGTFYGGNGVQTFQLPNLQGRVPISFGAGFNQGEIAGEEAHMLLSSEMPGHTHTVNGSTATATVLAPTGNLLATTGDDPYTTTPPATPVGLSPGTVASVGGGQPHENRQPYLVLNVCIALTGIFPSRN